MHPTSYTAPACVGGPSAALLVGPDGPRGAADARARGRRRGRRGTRRGGRAPPPHVHDVAHDGERRVLGGRPLAALPAAARPLSGQGRMSAKKIKFKTQHSQVSSLQVSREIILCFAPLYVVIVLFYTCYIHKIIV